MPKPIRQRNLLFLPIHALLGAFMLGLRRLENTNDAPALDLAVLEETLGYLESVAQPMRLERYGRHNGWLAVAIGADGFEAEFAESLKYHHYREIDAFKALIRGAHETSKYLVEIKVSTVDMTSELAQDFRTQEFGFEVTVGFGDMWIDSVCGIPLPLFTIHDETTYWLVDYRPEVQVVVMRVDENLSYRGGHREVVDLPAAPESLRPTVDILTYDVIPNIAVRIYAVS